MSRKKQVGVGMTRSRTKLGKFIRARRIGLQMSQSELARQSELTLMSVSNLEVGKQKSTTQPKLDRLAVALGCDIEDLRKRIPSQPLAPTTTKRGKYIRSRREELGMSIEEFAARMKITLAQARRLEVGKHPKITYCWVKPLIRVLKLDPIVLSQFVGNCHKKTDNKLGQLIRSRRMTMGISLENMAARLDVSRQYVNQVEFGQRSLANSDGMFSKLARVLKLNVGTLKALRSERKVKSVRDPQSLGGFLTARRIAHHLTQAKLAVRLGTSALAVTQFETGRSVPSVSVISKFKEVLGCEIPGELTESLVRRRPGRPRKI